MKGDFSRDTFDPAKHFTRVLMQQGRVLLDSDWNEQTSLLLHYLRTLAADIIGPHGGPVVGCGFHIAALNLLHRPTMIGAGASRLGTSATATILAELRHRRGEE